MKNGRRPVPEFHPPHWSPVMAVVFLVTLGIVAAVIR
jgi:hypothetical protein